ncbi:LysR substrate-binding domain-containing protein [Pseudomonas sp. NPDC008258]|uniref:LysR family transcriptional regulator n=1 Tax=Pseudomonas sp. NPDC008258 TaxID=3364418 RepID=UPI0036E07DA9
MYHSYEILEALVHSESCGSFSAAARHLGKRQSTISELVSRIETDINTEIFVRGARSLKLTPAGAIILKYAREVLTSADRLRLQTDAISQGQEPKLTLVLSDTYQPGQYQERLQELDLRYPELQFECLIAENKDVVSHISQGRGQLGLTEAQSHYPADISHARLAQKSHFGLFVKAGHHLLTLSTVRQEHLGDYRMLRLSSLATDHEEVHAEVTQSLKTWSAPDYLTLLEMAAMGFGWGILPKALVEAYGNDRLEEITALGWPKQLPVDVIWSRKQLLGPAAIWLLERLMAE